MPRSKTVRFTRVVERSGQPQSHALWLPPDKDPEFKRALAAHRVMSVQPRRGKTDQAFVGFDEQRSKGGQFLIFPKSLKPFEGAEIVGIKFDLVEQPKRVPAKGDQPVVPAAARKASTAAAKARTAREIIAARETELEPERARRPARAAPPKRTRGAAAAAPRASHTNASRSASPDTALLVREIRSALKELQRGKTVAAYKRLERALPS